MTDDRCTGADGPAPRRPHRAGAARRRDPPCARRPAGRGRRRSGDRRRAPGALHRAAPCTSSRSRRCGGGCGRWRVARSRSPSRRRLRRLRRRRLLARSWSARAPDEIRAFHNSCLHRGTRCAPSPGRVDRAALSLPRVHLEPRRVLRRHAVPVGLPPRRPGHLLPARGAGGDVGRVRVRERRPRGAEPLESTISRSCPSTSRPGPSRSATSAPTSSASCRATGRWPSRPSSRATTPWPSIPSCSRRAGDTQTEYDVYQGVRHVNRMITPVGIASEHVDRTWPSRTSSTPCSSPRTTPTPPSPTGPPPATSWPSAPAGSLHRAHRRATTRDVTDCEALDAIEYFVFPNFMPWAGYTTPLVYRFRPHGDDHTAALMDVMLLEPVPVDGTPAGAAPDPPPRPRRELGRRPRARLPRAASSTRTPPPWAASSRASRPSAGPT